MSITDTASSSYTKRLYRLEHAWWKKLLNVQLPYKLHLKALKLGQVLEIGCGIGRNLDHLAGYAVGVDHNPDSVAIARNRGFEAFIPEEFFNSNFAKPNSFDSILLAHVAEHMTPKECENLLSSYLDLLKPAGRIIFITPQERGYNSDSTHVTFANFIVLKSIAQNLNLKIESIYSFPFPRILGNLFKYNEFVLIAKKPIA